MNTPIIDFLNSYADSDSVRAHMPGHKGRENLCDITEIRGADSLYEASGIIAKSEQNASALFGAHTFYSTEGSSLVIRAMLYLASVYKGGRLRVLAARNAHRAFVTAAALLDIDIEWLYGDSYLSCNVTADMLCERFEKGDVPDAFYITSPDYLGNTQDIAALCGVCRRYGVLSVVDNAHGAYLKFLQSSRHPIDLGCDMCADSAHKTLPVLTGGAYLHISKSAPRTLVQNAKNALALFGSTSPSYLILASLDGANAYLETHNKRLSRFLPEVVCLKTKLCDIGFEAVGDEPLKITLKTKPYGYTGKDVALHLEKQGVICEFADPDYIVLMLTPENSGEMQRILDAFKTLEKREEIKELPPAVGVPDVAMSVRRATLSESENISVSDSIGRICAAVTVGCPPAVALVVSGELITRDAVTAFEYYGIEKINVIKGAVKILRTAKSEEKQGKQILKSLKK